MLGPPGLLQLRAFAAFLCAAAVAACGSSDTVDETSAAPLPDTDTAPADTETERERPSARRSTRFPGPPDDARPARVTGVTDGDTIMLGGLGRVRLIGVDTPEVHGRVECYGREASAFAKWLLPDGARVRYRLGLEERDRYGRALAYVWLEDGRMVNGLLAERGYAQPLTIPPNVDYADLFVAAAREAREAGRGLWAEEACPEEQSPGGAGSSGGGGSRADRDCSDFATRAEAQRYFESIGGSPSNNADRLDGDGDGRACERLP